MFNRRTILKTMTLLPALNLLQTRASTLPTQADVLVIGAGAAGLAAARQLVDRGRTVIVIEGRNRMGGRVWTDRSWPNLPLDMGASWIHGVTDNPLTNLVRQFKLKTVATDFENYALYDWQGTKIPDDKSSELDALVEEVLEETAERGENRDRDAGLQTGIEAVINNKGWDETTRLRFNAAINTTVEHEYAADTSQLSLWWWNEGKEFGGDQVIFPNGYDQLFTALAKGVDIRLQQIVQRIEYGDSGVRVVTNQGVFTAKQAVVTLPLGVLKRGTVQFDPPLPAWKSVAIQRLGMGLLNKTYLRFSEAFWDEEAHLIGFMSKRKGEWAEWVNFQQLIGKPVLLGFNAGTYGRKIETWSDEKIVAAALATLRTIYGATPTPGGWKITRWAQDPFVYGSYSYMAVGATPEDYTYLAKPVRKRLFFAGEHTHRDYAATVHGALLSGQRAASEILA